MLGNLTPAVQARVLEQMQERPKLVVLDTMNFWMDTALDSLKAVIKQIDILTINDEEARQLSGEHSLVKAAAVIHEMGPKTLVIKKGEHGALLFQDQNIFFAPALPLIDVFDPTGAGDTFAGGFIGYLAATRDNSFENLKRAVIYGSAMASFCSNPPLKLPMRSVVSASAPWIDNCTCSSPASASAARRCFETLTPAVMRLV